MGHRSKVLDTEGPTPKFLFAIIKQLDLKAIDWNKVASELEISNGHAARMRYSRFRNQMEGPLGQRGGKKKAKKAKDDPKAALQTTPYVPPPETMPKLEPTEPKTEPGEPSFSTPAHMKTELGGHIEPVDHSFHDSSLSYQMFQQTTQGYDGASQQMQQSMPIGIPYQFPVLPSSMSPSMSSPVHYSSSPSYGYPYQAYESADISLQDFGLQSSPFHNAPITPWEPPSPSRRFQPKSIKIEDDVDILEPKVEKVELADNVVDASVEGFHLD
ncbi:hypothetical protein N7512_005874 [Penicillium capsulatum]|nr:hypothetical protein N7512_005874 [Penicillium capsulatum]